jgi:hypothetical protein
VTRKFCDHCGKPAARNEYPDASMKISAERSAFILRALFETEVEPHPCGSIGLSSKRVSTAEICPACMLLLIDALRERVTKDPAA